MKKLNEFLNVNNLYLIDENQNFCSYDMEQFIIHLHDCSENIEKWFHDGLYHLFNFVNNKCINNYDFLCFRYFPSDDIYIFVNLRSDEFIMYDCDFQQITNDNELYYKIIKILCDICNL